ncbi:MAG TPA: molecular chaperone DnaK, partial [Thauera sp.]|nr:molecular chaperone DnaK [Thauera sp.]
AIKSGDKDSIEAKSQALAMAAQKLGEQMYAQAEGGAQGAEGGQSAGGKADDADVVDAEFTEVKDKK